MVASGVDVEPWDRWLRDFSTAATTGLVPLVASSRRPPRSSRDGDDAVVRLNRSGIDVDKDVNVELDFQPVSRLRSAAKYRDEHTQTPETKTAAPA